MGQDRLQIVSGLMDQLNDLIAQMYQQTMLSEKFPIDTVYEFEDATIFFVVRDLGEVEYYLRTELLADDVTFTVLDSTTGEEVVRESLVRSEQYWLTKQPEAVKPKMDNKEDVQ